MERQASSRLHARQQPSHLHTRVGISFSSSISSANSVQTPSPLLDTTIRAPFDIETEEDDVSIILCFISTDFSADYTLFKIKLIQRDLSRTALANVPKEILDEVTILTPPFLS